MSKRRNWTNEVYGRYGTGAGRQIRDLERDAHSFSREANKCMDALLGREDQALLEKRQSLIRRFTVGDLHEALVLFSQPPDVHFAIGEVFGWAEVADAENLPQPGNRFQVRIVEIDLDCAILRVELVRPSQPAAPE